jgi:hypothetical protein
MGQDGRLDATLRSNQRGRPRPRRDLHYPAAWLAKDLTRRMRVVTRSRVALWFWKKRLQCLELRSLTDRA